MFLAVLVSIGRKFACEFVQFFNFLPGHAHQNFIDLVIANIFNHVTFVFIFEATHFAL